MDADNIYENIRAREYEPGEVILEVIITPKEDIFGVFISAENLKTAAEVDAYNNAIQRVLRRAGLHPRHNTALVEEHEPGKHYWEITTAEVNRRTEQDVADQIRGLFDAIYAEAKQLKNKTGEIKDTATL